MGGGEFSGPPARGAHLAASAGAQDHDGVHRGPPGRCMSRCRHSRPPTPAPAPPQGGHRGGQWQSQSRLSHIGLHLRSLWRCQACLPRLALIGQPPRRPKYVCNHIPIALLLHAATCRITSRGISWAYSQHIINLIMNNIEWHGKKMYGNNVTCRMPDIISR